MHGRPPGRLPHPRLADGEAHIIRNAGGVVTDDEIRSLAISQRLLGIESSPFVTKRESLCGFVFDVATGTLNEVTV